MDSFNTKGKCLLSLDGGGVRGLSSLYILNNLMIRLNNARKSAALPSVKPCEVFDLIGGTSTGGLIAIMLGRLEMEVEQCINAYITLAVDIFAEKEHKTKVQWKGKLQAQFDSKKLKAAFEKVVADQGFALDTPFNDGKDRACHVMVVAASKDISGVITVLRSYDLPEKPDNSPATIVEAAMATSAATGFFDSVAIDGCTLVDGALGANNPVNQVESEATDIWCPETGDLKSQVKCFISVGTGKPSFKKMNDSAYKFATEDLVKLTTETEKTARNFISRWRQHYDQARYFRFNVQDGLQEVGLDEYNEVGVIKTATKNYLEEQDQVSRVRAWVENMKQKEVVQLCNDEFI